MRVHFLAAVLLDADAAVVMRMMQEIPGELICVLNDVARHECQDPGHHRGRHRPKIPGPVPPDQEPAGQGQGRKAGRKGHR